ncbi:MAG: DUF45 domain-containing protein [Deinococcus-Thermus bacterium]|jgi:predicted metal-dependent hydrolase|nr:DUF45 domain-containing protein [Deinococcota bacterium]
MDHHDLSGAPPVRVHLRRSGRARRMSLRVSRLDGRVTLTIPPRASRRAAVSFAEERGPWIRRHLADLRAPEPVRLGGRVPVEGVALTVVSAPRSELRAEAGEIAVSRRAASVAGAVSGLLKTLARDRLTAASDAYASRVRRAYTRLTLRDTRSRWGSCSEEGALMYSWRLAMAPPDVLDYVAAHEVAHLVRMDHSPAFWDTVADLVPGYEAPRRWLRQNGQELHRYRFADGRGAD